MKKILCLLFILQFNLSNAQEELNLLPWPQSIELNKQKHYVNASFNVRVEGNFDHRIYPNVEKFLRRLDGRTGLFLGQEHYDQTKNIMANAPLMIRIEEQGSLALGMDESYHLSVRKNKINIDAKTDIGAIRGLETLLQLLHFDDKGFYFHGCDIKDFPRFQWRGLMIDVARHFEPIHVIKRNIDAMAAVKLNLLHLHLSDDQGWRVEINSHPKLTELASDGQFYTQQEIKEIVAYAAEKGIMVMPEIDVPGHATAILTAYPELGSKKMSYRLERNAGIFDPTLNPIIPETYTFLDEIFSEIAPLFPFPYFHIGGDENEGKHWDENKEIEAFKKKHKFKDNHELQTYFNLKLVDILKPYGKRLMGWEEIMTPQMSKSAIIHSWKGVNEGLPAGQSLVNAAKAGFQTVLSNGYYIDLNLPVSSHYEVDPLVNEDQLTQKEKNRILGGEATMWGELVTPVTIDSRIWPRTAAIAERFWSDKTIKDLESLYKRLDYTSFRLEELGLTHIRNKNVILRNLSNNQSTEALEKLMKICEPLKIYTRNIEGTEYQSHSPFVLFADACTTDAIDAFYFQKAIEKYANQKNKKNRQAILNFFKDWATIYKSLNQQKKQAPLIKDLLPLAKNIEEISLHFIELMDSNSITDHKKSVDLLKLDILDQDFADVQIVIKPSLIKLNKILKNEL